MDVNALRLFIIVGAATLVIGCATTPPVPPAQPTTPPVGQPAPTEQSATPKQQPPPPASAEVSPHPQAPKDHVQKGRIKVTKAEYNKTFEDVRQLIETLNHIIAARDYKEWLRYLTSKYVETYSSPKTLERISNEPMLKRYNLRVTSLKEYFLDVVVPSRANARLDDLDFVDKSQVKAITIIDGQRYILYDLRLVDGGWKVGVS